jgi:MoxR-like ATPase
MTIERERMHGGGWGPLRIDTTTIPQAANYAVNSGEVAASLVLPACPIRSTWTDQEAQRKEFEERKAAVDPAAAARKITELFDRLAWRGGIVGREDALQQSKFALITQHHQVLIGEHGTGKSAHARMVFSMLADDCKKFLLQASKRTQLEDLVGAVDLMALKRGELWHKTANSAVDADVALLDEMFKLPVTVLHSLYSLLNEREFVKGVQYEKSKLRSCFGTSNPEDLHDQPDAVLDRLLCFSYIQGLDTTGDKLRMVKRRRHSSPIDNGERLTHAEYEVVGDIIAGSDSRYTIHLPPHVAFIGVAALERFQKTLEDKSLWKSFRLKPSNRRLNQSFAFVEAAAFLRDPQVTTVATVDDLYALTYVHSFMGDKEKTAEILNEVIRDTIRGIPESDRHTIDALSELDDALAERFISYQSGGLSFKRNLLQRIKCLLGLESTGSLVFRDLSSFVEKQRPVHPAVQSYQQNVKASLDAYIRTFNKTLDEPVRP